MFPLGAMAPDFSLTDTRNNKQVTLSDVKSEVATVVMFICNHCPYVKHIKAKLSEVANLYATKGIAFVAINANDADTFTEDAPDKMKKDAIDFNYTFPYCYDETQAVAKSIMAVLTPDFFVVDSSLKCVYRGRFDDSNHKNGKPSTGKDLTATLDLMLEGKKIPAHQEPSAGCNIKWRTGINPF